MNINEVQRRTSDAKPDWTFPSAVVLAAVVVSVWVVWAI